MNAILFMFQNKMEDNNYFCQNLSDLKIYILNLYKFTSSSAIFVNVFYYVLLLKYFKIYSQWLINYNPCKFTMIIAGPLPGNPLEFLFWKDFKRRSISPSACPIHISSILNWPLLYMHSSTNKLLAWLITDVLMFSAFKIIALEKRVYGFPNKLVFCFKKAVAVPFSF